MGGNQYENNLFADQEDQLFVEDLIYLYLSPDLKHEVEEVPCTIDVTIGADTMQVNGKSYPLDVPAYINDAGYTMLPMRALVENLPEEVQKKSALGRTVKNSFDSVRYDYLSSDCRRKRSQEKW